MYLPQAPEHYLINAVFPCLHGALVSDGLTFTFLTATVTVAVRYAYACVCWFRELRSRFAGLKSVYMTSNVPVG